MCCETVFETSLQVAPLCINTATINDWLMVLLSNSPPPPMTASETSPPVMMLFTKCGSAPPSTATVKRLPTTS